MPTMILEAPFTATTRQNDLARAWTDPLVTRLLASGAIRSGKTQAAARLLVESALRFPSQYLVSRQTYQTLRDTTQRAMLYGDGPLPPLIPPAALRGQSLKSGYNEQTKRATLANGSEIVFRSLEESDPEKIRGLTLGGVLIDQIEELRFEEGEHLFDEILGRLSDERGPRKLLAIANPAGLDHWLYRRFYREPDPGSGIVHFTLHDNEQNLDPAYFAGMVATRETRPAWYRTFVLGEWGAIADAAYVIEDAHLIPAFNLAEAASRFEAADYGLNGAPWAGCAVDYDGNLIFHDMLYEKELTPSQLAPLIHKKRVDWGEPTAAYIDPSVWRRTWTVDQSGLQIVLGDLFPEHGISLKSANNDPRAGLMRLRELLLCDREHLFPLWHPTRAGEPGSPRVFFTPRCERLVAELKSAPLQPLEKRDGGEIVDPVWESRSGHAAAMARYAAMTRPRPSERASVPLEDPRAELMRLHIERRDRPRPVKARYTT